MIVHIPQKGPKVTLYQFRLQPLQVTGDVAHIRQHAAKFNQPALKIENALESWGEGFQDLILNASVASLNQSVTGA
jgi:hypothetical protein